MTSPRQTVNASVDIALQPGQTVAFFGASITEAGWASPTGFIRLIASGLEAVGTPIVVLPAGVSGNTSRDMLARMERDIIQPKPDWVSIDAGRNDVWHGTVDFPEYLSNLTAMVDRAQAAGIRVILQTCTPIGEDLGNELNAKLAFSIHFQRYLAAQKKCLLADLSDIFHRVLADKPVTDTDNWLTTDGVHPNPRGDRLLAVTWLQDCCL